MKIRTFVNTHFRHFNAAALRAAATSWCQHVDEGGAMMVTLAGAMSTAELGRSLAELIRQDRVDAISCTGANLEEDLFNLVAHRHYHSISDWRNLSPEFEKELERSGLNRVTDTCIPESEAFRAIEEPLLALWKRADAKGTRAFPHEYLYELVRESELDFQIDPRDSWLLAAAEKNLPLFTPGWEDSTLGNIFVAHVLAGDLSSCDAIRGGTEYMVALADYYVRTTMGESLRDFPESRPDVSVPRELATQGRSLGLFQVGGGIAGDFPICVVPMIHQDLGKPCPYWGYFCQISDSTPSYGSYSGAFPTEKISWGKLDVDTPRFVIESDATIVAPLVFAYVLDW